MVSLWWVAAAFFVGSYVGAVLVGLLSIARRDEDDACVPHVTGAPAPVNPEALDEAREEHRRRRKHNAGRSCSIACAVVLLLAMSMEAGYVGAGYYASTHVAADEAASPPLFRAASVSVTQGLAGATLVRRAAPSVAAAPAIASTMPFRSAVDRAAPSVVTVVAARALKRPADPSATDTLAVGLGSGVVVDRDGFIMTSNHVIDGASEIMVALGDDTARRVRLVGADADSDLALLKVDDVELQPIVITDLPSLAVGRTARRLPPAAALPRNLRCHRPQEPPHRW